MWNIKLSKFKQIYASTFFPRLFLKQSKCLKNNCNVKHLSAVRKSAATKVKNEGQPFIVNDTIVQKGDDVTFSVRDDLLNGNIIAPKYYQIPPCTKCQSVISKLFGIKTHKTPDVDSQGIKAQATTATLEEEKLAQKIEIVDETPHVEAHPEKIEGFNTNPRILGEKITKFDVSNENNSSSKQGLTVDELAKRCLDTSIGDIDKTLLNELKNIAKTKSAINTDIDYVHKFANSERRSIISDQNKNSNESEIYMYEIEKSGGPLKVEKIQPLHLDTVPYFTIDDGNKDFKPVGLFGDPLPLLKASIEDNVMEIPSQLSPYDQQAIPFYEYTNKEHVFEDDPDLETAAISETVREAEYNNPLQVGDTIRKEAVGTEKRTLENPEIMEEPLRPQPTLNNLCEPLLTFHGENEDCLKTFKADHVSSIFVTQQLLTSATSWRSDGISLREEGPSATSAISATLPYPPKTSSSRQQLESGNDSAISAHQNPGEFYEWKMPVQFSPYSTLYSYIHSRRSLIEHSVTRNLVFASLPELEVSDANNVVDTKTIPKTPECMDRVVQPIDISATDKIPLSVLLKRIQERSKLEYCRELFSKAKADFVEAKRNCPPPPANNPPKACPCKPIPKPKDDNPCPCPKKEKKDPCAKFVPFFFNLMYKTYTTDLKIPIQSSVSALLNKTKLNTPSLALLTDDVIESLKKLGKTLNIKANSDNAFYARDFEPWIPIPSFPYPKIEEKRPFVCPKDGCKDPKAQKSCKDNKHLGESRKNMLSLLIPSKPLFLPILYTCTN